MTYEQILERINEMSTADLIAVHNKYCEAYGSDVVIYTY